MKSMLFSSSKVCIIERDDSSALSNWLGIYRDAVDRARVDGYSGEVYAKTCDGG